MEVQPIESVLIDGIAYEIPAPVAAELLRLHLDAKQPQDSSIHSLAQERKEAEHQYIVTAFNYPEAPIGSRDWVLYWAGWLARSSAFKTT